MFTTIITADCELTSKALFHAAVDTAEVAG
jgi:hypothetical protein